MNIQLVGIEGSSRLLYDSGKLGARMYVEAEVAPWFDANGGDPLEVPLYVDKSGNPAPFEF